MKVQRTETKACCGATAIAFKTDKATSIDLISFLKQNSFKELEHFTKAGIMYVESSDLIVTSTIGSTSMTIKCRSKNCETAINELEDILSKI